MHELGVLSHAISMVDRIAAKNNILQVKYITLEVGESSGYVPLFFEKLFPVATDAYPAIKDAQLRIQMAAGDGLVIKEIGY